MIRTTARVRGLLGRRVLFAIFASVIAGGLTLPGHDSSPTAFAAALSAHSSPSDASRSEADGKKWSESPIGVVPNRFGELFTIAGNLPDKYTLVFRNARREIRVIEVNGNTLPDSLILLTRVPETRPSERSDANASGKRRSRKEKDASDGWEEKVAGVIPERFGRLVEVSGVRGTYSLVFVNDEQEIRVIPFQGNEVKKIASLYRQTPLGVKSENSPKARVEDKADDGWTDMVQANLPEHFGSIVTASSASSKTRLVFENALGDLTITNIQPNQKAKIAYEILRFVPSPSERAGRDAEFKERKKQGFRWQVQRGSVLPDSYGQVLRIDGVETSNLVLRDYEGQLRLVHWNGKKLSTRASLIERPVQTKKREFTDEEKWDLNPIGAIPEEFGELRGYLGDPESPHKALLVFQDGNGELRLIFRNGGALPNKLKKITREY